MVIGVDMGGTNIRAALCDGFSLNELIVRPCPANASEEGVFAELCNTIDAVFCDEVTAIGVGVPSLVDTENGVIYDTVNIPSWKKLHLKELLEERYGVRVEVNNDANCFALGEHRFGSAKGYRNVVGIISGTGVGSGIVLDGKIYPGASFAAGEIGEMIYRDHNYEYYCSSTFFVNYHGMTAKEAAERARFGDAAALRAWDEYAVHLGNLILSVIYAFNPEVVVIGGGISSAADLFKTKLDEKLAECKFLNTLKNTRVKVTGTENIAILGAAASVL